VTFLIHFSSIKLLSKCNKNYKPNNSKVASYIVLFLERSYDLLHSNTCLAVEQQESGTASYLYEVLYSPCEVKSPSLEKRDGVSDAEIPQERVDP